MKNNIKYLKSSLNDEIAYCHDDMGSDISIFFFGGYSSDMTGTKATALSKWCLKNKYNFTRFDYSGHGQSGGKFEDGGITKWSVEANEIFQSFKNKKILLLVLVWEDGFHYLLQKKILKRFMAWWVLPRHLISL